MVTSTVPRTQLSPEQKDRMFYIMSLYYSGVDRSQFESDLSEKQDVILLLDKDKVIQGFSTILVKKVKTPALSYIAIYSGDTVLTQEYWGQGDLAFAFGKYLIATRIKNPRQEIYWFLISKGYKTYLLMTNNFLEHWPRYEKGTPKDIKSLMDDFYTERFFEKYNPKTGIMVPDKSKSQAIKHAVADIDAEVLKKPRVHFFNQNNPGWVDGEELCCVARVTMHVPFFYFFKFCRKKLLSLIRPTKKIRRSLI